MVSTHDNTQATLPADAASIPAHVQSRLVYDFDFVLAPLGAREPQREVGRLLFAEAPEIFFTPRNGGHWVVTRAEVAVDMLRKSELFSANPRHNPVRAFKPPLLPVQSDPPDHTEYRKVLGAFFAPGNMRKLEPDIRTFAASLIDGVLGNGGCEFIEEIGEVFPIIIFLRLVGADMRDRPRLLAMAQKFTRSTDPQDRAAAIAELAAYLRGLLEQRRGESGDDILSRFIKSDYQGRPLHAHEEEGLSTLLFLGGLDTVKSVLSFIMLYLARNPDQFAKLVEEPDKIPAAIEELIRINGVSVPERGATHDFEYRGVRFRENDRVIFLTQVMGFDDRAVAEPERVDFDREASPHLSFGAGHHRCAGSHLARIEIRVFLEEWVKRISSFRLDAERGAKMAPGVVWTPDRAYLKWEAPQP
ncbi:cytochrome P450 [Aquamicrobium sp. LC103]|uniref:cytochrome P450 n=1 Tax=Aquamicrobium sp. LC103 TaxID=1120658 RepID=UPI00069B44C0|nr:cytochrome P450 [Aquamicrobium sp. LC103]TKT74476.1 cytochrome P450 [Aquamicrobium sp. LC103]